MHNRIFKRLKNYNEVKKYFENTIKDKCAQDIMKKVLFEEENHAFKLVEEVDKVKFLKFYRSGSCELCYEEYVDSTKKKLEKWQEEEPDFRDNSLNLEIIFEVREK